MQITVISVSSPETKTKGKNKWQEITLAYKSDKGDKEKKFPSYVDIYETIRTLEDGCTYEVRLQKDGDYWQWVGVEKIEGTTKATTTGGKSSSGGNDWAAKTQLDRERFEFDKEKQILIIRQSSLERAIEFFGEGNAQLKDVVNVAESFATYVQTGSLPSNAVAQDADDEPDID